MPVFSFNPGDRPVFDAELVDSSGNKATLHGLFDTGADLSVFDEQAVRGYVRRYASDEDVVDVFSGNLVRVNRASLESLSYLGRHTTGMLVCLVDLAAALTKGRAKHYDCIIGRDFFLNVFQGTPLTLTLESATSQGRLTY